MQTSLACEFLLFQPQTVHAALQAKCRVSVGQIVETGELALLVARGKKSIVGLVEKSQFFGEVGFGERQDVE